MRIRNGTITHITTPALISGSYTGDSETAITVSFTVASPCANPDKSGGCGVLITFGAHVSKKSQWVTYGGEAGAQTASSINGSPHHVALLALDGNAIGQRDNQMASNPIASLRLEKIVDNTAGGSALPTAWTLTASGPTNISAAGDTGVRLVRAGNYTLSESAGPAGYSASNWSCSFNGGPWSEVPSAAITLEIGDAAYCTITNTAIAPRLKLVKTVTNDNGGPAQPADWTLTATGSGGFSGTGSPASGPTATLGPNPVKAGVVYTLSESGPSGCTASSWVWVGGTQSGSDITLALGQSATCTITNDDQPAQLTLVKVIHNDYGGTKTPADFTLSAAGPTPISGPGGVTSCVNAGTYTLSETTLPDYAAGLWECVGGTQSGAEIPLGLGQSATCTIHNNDIPARIIIVKNAKGGNGTFNFELTGPGGPWTPSVTTSGTPNGAGTNDLGAIFSAGSYAFAELTPPAGWTFTGLSCDAGASQHQNAGGFDDLWGFELANGQTVTCTAENTAALTTRTQGFWSTHTILANDVWNSGSLILGSTPVVGSGDEFLCKAPTTPITATATEPAAPVNQLMGGV